jgi:hypothetical protein
MRDLRPALTVPLLELLNLSEGNIALDRFGNGLV